MDAPTVPPATIPGYGLAPPGEADARAALARVFGPRVGEEHWERACRAAGVHRGAVGAGEPLARAAAALCEAGGAVAMVGRSIEIRMRTHVRLAALARPAPAGEDR